MDLCCSLIAGFLISFIGWSLLPLLGPVFDFFFAVERGIWSVIDYVDKAFTVAADSEPRA
jgi:hypothetical protein